MSTEGRMVILAGTDFTARAAEAAEVAAALSLRTGDPVLLVHVLDGESGAEAALERLHAEADRLHALFPSLPVETRLETGIPDEALTGLARLLTAASAKGEQGARLIVVSSLGRRAPARWVLGSVAERMAQTSPVAVLVVRDTKPFVSWQRGERSLRVVVGFDFAETSTAALRWVSELSRLAPCEVILAHVTWPAEKRERSRAHWAFGGLANVPALETLLRSDIGKKLREQAWKELPAIRIRLSQGRRAAALADLAAEEKADLLVVGRGQIHGSGRLWQETVSCGALYHASMSVACVPLPAAAPHARQVVPEPPGDEDQVHLARRLEAHPFLRGASGDVLRRLASITQEVAFDRGAVLLREGDDASTLFLLESGIVTLELGVPGKGATRVESLRAGDIVGLSWLFPPYRWHLDGRAVEPTLALAIDARHLREWMTEDAEIGQAIAMRLVGPLYERLERVRMQRLDLYKAEP